MRRILLFIFIITGSFLYFSFAEAQNPQSSRNNPNKLRLTKKWETKQDLKIPESVIYDASRDILYVSNINGKPMEKNGNGFISKVTLNGEIKILKWITGLNAPKGLAIYHDKLFVSDIDQLIEIDIKSGQILNKYLVKEARFLNDVTVDTSGNVYVSDMSYHNSAIYKLSHGKIALWLRNNEIRQPNGLYAESNRLIVGNSGDGHLKAVNLSDKKISIIANIGSGIDGVEEDEKGNYFVSDWKGKTSFVSRFGQIMELLDTTNLNINSADIEYIKNKNLLLIPTFYDNRIMAYQVK